jgi:hypothetical protein
MDSAVVAGVRLIVRIVRGPMRPVRRGICDSTVDLVCGLGAMVSMVVGDTYSVVVGVMGAMGVQVLGDTHSVVVDIIGAMVSVVFGSMR